ncbi:trypsin-like peptidase domain containing protein [Nitzschia inconspicua]|uniref:Trypsin-like peptidase domain containing protein n=1 Tax=Nitzschia inconspicua TaxID=303405 RepID=A0A9K3LA26_9STRA|nr:trypsin-like peptidase domain containing protein [Nitzschia inconspicua]
MDETSESDNNMTTPVAERTMLLPSGSHATNNCENADGTDIRLTTTTTMIPGAPDATPEATASVINTADMTTNNNNNGETACISVQHSSLQEEGPPETPNSSMLREWNHCSVPNATAAMTPTTAHHSIPHDHHNGNGNGESPMPPVAPAIVLARTPTPQNGHTADSTPQATSRGHNRISSGGNIVNLLGSTVSVTALGNSVASNATYSYPVATFVSNFVRNVSEIRDEIRGHIYAAAIPEHSTHTDTAAAAALEGNTNSHDNNMSRPRNYPPSHIITSTRSEPPMSTATTQRDLDDMMMAVTDDHNAQQEYVLIDGDLVAIPVASHQPRGRLFHRRGFHRHHSDDDLTEERNGRYPAVAAAASGSGGEEDMTNASPNDISRTEEQEMFFLEQQDRSSCKSSRMRRGVKKFKRWKKNLKKKFGLQRKDDTTGSMGANEQVVPSELGTTDEENSAQFSVLTSPPAYHPSIASHQSQQSAGIATTASTRSGTYIPDDDNSTIATNAAQSVSENSSSRLTPASSPARPAGAKHRFPQKKKRKNLVGWLRDASDRSNQSISSSSLITHPTSAMSLSSGRSVSGASPTSLPASSLNTTPMNRDASAQSFGDNSSIDSSNLAAGSNLTAPPMTSRAAMPTLPETSMEFRDQQTSAQAEFTALSPLHAPATLSCAPPRMYHDQLGHPPANEAGDTIEPLMLDPHSWHRSSSIAAEASFVGNADSCFVEAGVLPDSVAATEYYIEDRLDDYDKFDDKKATYDPYLRSMVPRDADFKVDKQEAPSVDNMLREAGRFAQDLEESTQDTPIVPRMKMGPKGKSDGESVPLSMATSKDTLVHNDILKLVLVGANDVDKSGLARKLRKSSKKQKKRNTLAVDVHSWMPPNSDDVKFTVWDVHGATGSNDDPYASNFGAHPGTQSLFFSDRSLYLLVWDMAASNRKTFRRMSSLRNDDDSDCDSDDSDDEDEDLNEYLTEEANRQADRALQTDIEDRVLSWLDTVARRGAHSAVLPIALVPSDMSPAEAKRRCDVMQALIMEHTERKFPEGLVPPKVLSGAETVICVSLSTNMGLDYLEEMILDIATDASHSVFDHVGTPVPVGAVEVLETVRRLKENSNKLVLVDHLMAELPIGVDLSVEAVMHSLYFLASIGEVLYFGGSDEMLSHYVILSRKWLVSALSCILRNDLKRELSETRRFMNMQCLYSDQQFPESHVTQTFCNNASSCPVVSSQDTQMLWQSMSFMREAADRSSQLNENSTTASTMFNFLERLLVHTGVFLPLDIDRFASTDNVYFVPSLLSKASASDVWTYKSSDSWMTTLCHSWLFRDGSPVGLIEHITVALLRDLYEFSHVVASTTNSANNSSHMPPARSQTYPFAQNSLTEFLESHGEGEPIGQIKIHHIVCWKNSVLIKIGRVFSEGSDLRESFVEVFVAITDQSSPHAVASDAMRSNMQRLVVSGKGQVGHHGRKLWKGGYNIVLDSIKASVADCTNVDRQVICPECLAYAHPSSASTWSWDSVRAASDPIVRCMRGHRVDRNLICGTIPAVSKVDSGKAGDAHKKPITTLLPAVVVVGLWDNKDKVIRNVGSGFIVDKKLGLIVTAGHVLFNMEEGRQFGEPYFGLHSARAVIGIIPDGGKEGHAVFRYFAEIVAEDIHNMDACVLKITSKLKDDVDNDTMVGDQPEEILENVHKEPLQAMKMTRRFELEETVRVMGFNQGGEGLLEKGKHVNRSVDFAKGYIVKQFKMTDDHSSSSGDSSSTGCGFQPREEIVIMCPTISGHSGGPCVNDEGKVVGILSRGDPVDRQRCYLVPSSEIKSLVNKAKMRGGLKIP